FPVASLAFLSSIRLRPKHAPLARASAAAYARSVFLRRVEWDAADRDLQILFDFRFAIGRAAPVRASEAAVDFRLAVVLRCKKLVKLLARSDVARVRFAQRQRAREKIVLD